MNLQVVTDFSGLSKDKRDSVDRTGDHGIGGGAR